MPEMQAFSPLPHSKTNNKKEYPVYI